ncbi:MAG: 2-hydroxyacid dehydrogenase [Actinobacteria bacterium]|nr:2-hydroxyacid dehydrogenase [Actinomycetota bacterium]
MDVCMFSTRGYDRASFTAALAGSPHHVRFVESRLSLTTVSLAEGCEAICAFVNDDLGEAVLHALAGLGVRHVALRSAGFNHVDLGAAARFGLSVVRVPAYSPNAVAEHTIALILAVNRHIPRAHDRVRDRNFSLEGLVGFDLKGKTAGVIGTGKIGALVARLLWHFRCNVVAADPVVDPSLVELGVRYVSLDELWPQCDIISLNAPLMDSTYHLVNPMTIASCKRGVMIVNTGRGPLIDTAAVVDGLKSGQIGSLALDVYEEEGALFFEDRSGDILDDDVFARLLTFPNVVITAHQAFLTTEALAAIAEVTLANLDDLAAGRSCPNQIGV